MNCPTLSDIRAAAKRIDPYIERTPVLTCSGLDRMVGAKLFFKCENFQKVGAFKFRGATNAVFSLPEEEARRGVATHSSGNHGAALALAARNRGIKAYVVMPENSATVKKEAVASYGAEITFCKPTQEAREAGLVEVVERTGATFVHPYNDYRIIAGQGTAAIELLDEIRDLDVVMAPIGGGGLVSGAALTVSELSPKTEIIGAEPEGADDAYRSIQEGRIVPSLNPRTICDGLRTSLGDKTFPIIREHVSRIVTVSDEVIIRAMRHLWERMKIVVEPSAAVPFGALLEGRIDLNDRRIGIIISGGNVDLERLPWLPTGDD
jgi:threonine dehydratase